MNPGPGKSNLLFAALLAVPLAAWLQACSHSQAAQNITPPAPQVTVAPVVARSLHHWAELTGQLQAVNTVAVHPRVSGVIDGVKFVEGARVQAGQLLFQIDPRPFQLEVDRLGAELQRARSQLEAANDGRARADRLYAQNAIAREEYEQLTAAAAEAAGAVGSVQAQLGAARLNLQFTQVRSPIDGHVSQALITAGNLVSSADMLTTVVADDRVYAYFDVDENTYLQFAQLRSATGARAGSFNPVYMGLVDEQGYPHEGRVDFVDNQVDAHSGTIRVRAVFDNHDRRFTPGLYARIKLIGSDSYQAVLIDDRAIGTDLGKKYVLVLKPDDTLDYRPVTLGTSIGDLRVVQDGLRPGDVVVIDGLQHVMPGIRVQPDRTSITVDPAALAQISAGPPAGTLLAAGHTAQ